MGILEIIIAGIAIANFLIGTFGGLIWKTQRDKIKDEKLRSTIDVIIRAAEELNASEQMKISKAEYTKMMIEKLFPKNKKSTLEIEVLIHAAIQAAKIGKLGKLKD